MPRGGKTAPTPLGGDAELMAGASTEGTPPGGVIIIGPPRIVGGPPTSDGAAGGGGTFDGVAGFSASGRDEPASLTSAFTFATMVSTFTGRRKNALPSRESG